MDAVFALALIHHLAISNNVPLTRWRTSLRGLCQWLIIEWVPKSDSQVQKLLRTRKDIFDGYTLRGLSTAFGTRFHVREAVDVNQSERRMYLFEKKN